MISGAREERARTSMPGPIALDCTLNLTRSLKIGGCSLTVTTFSKFSTALIAAIHRIASLCCILRRALYHITAACQCRYALRRDSVGFQVESVCYFPCCQTFCCWST